MLITLGLAMHPNSLLNPNNQNYPVLRNRGSMALIYTTARLARANINDPAIALTAAVGEIIAFNLPTTLFSADAQAAQRIVSTVQYIFSNPNTLSMFSNLTAAAYTNLPTGDNVPEVYNRNDLPQAYPFEEGDLNNLTVSLATKLLAILAQFPTPDFINAEVRLLTHYIIGFIKSGTTTTRFLDKIRDGIRADLGLTISLDTNTTKLIYTQYIRVMQEGVAHACIDTMNELLPEKCMRLKLTLMQAAGANLTAITTIRTALLLYPDFPWGRVVNLYPEEARYVENAFTATRDDPCFGFRRDLGDVKSTNYKNFAYPAKELLIRCNGDAMLASYAGWIRTPRESATINAMITQYVENRSDRMAEEGDGNVEMRNRLIALVQPQQYT